MCAFGGCKQPESRGDELAHVVERAGPCRAEQRLQCGERLFDRIEVGTVGRKKPDVPSGRFNRGTTLRLRVDREMVKDDDVSATQRGDQDLFDVGKQRRTVDRTIKDGGGRETVEAQSRDDRVRLPMTARRVVMQPRAPRAAAIASPQIRRDPTLIEKDVLAHIAERLPGLPLATRRCDIRTTLFVGVDGFF